MDNTLFSQQAPALRDFFASVDAEDLKKSSSSISRYFNLSIDTDADWREVEYDFNRLFVGPAAIPAPLYASAYAEEPLLMGKATLEVRDAYRALGLEVPNKNATPDDHLAYELDAAAALGSMSTEDEATGLLRTWFIGDHLSGWIPHFAAAVRKQKDVSEPVLMAVEALTMWLESARAETGCTEE
ncbi:MAG: TorD/DmsD family molecular chaperone [Desulfovibrio sp.]|uniref:TorD/DmsD family molecular chaperone n=1 Tax=Desulfovibrio sp. 7SRBS1 TaxID=3378064 RepID=UPI003B3DFCE6